MYTNTEEDNGCQPKLQENGWHHVQLRKYKTAPQYTDERVGGNSQKKTTVVMYQPRLAIEKCVH